jgi:uncharacterized protein YneR
MELKVSKQAVNWFKDEFGVKQGEHIRFYVQFYGSSPIQEGYSLAFTKDNIINRVVSSEVDGVVFFVEESDLWFFDGYNLYVEYDEQEDALEYKYLKP